MTRRLQTPQTAWLAAGLLLLVLAAARPALAEKNEPKTRAFRQAFPPQAAEIRLDNLAGRIDLVRGDGRDVIVDATVHADAGSEAETRKLLDGMKWVRAQDGKGRDEWALSYPVETITAFHYPRGPRIEPEGWWLRFLASPSSSVLYRGERVRIYGNKRPSEPTLYVDLRIALPPGSRVAVRNAVGTVNGGGGLEGELSVDTGSGDVTLAAHGGRLAVDTGSGDVRLGTIRGETRIDTGSGDVTARGLIGNAEIKTGSGDVVLDSVSVGKLEASTGSGDVVVRGGDAGRLLADTGSGDVRLHGVELEELKADTSSGDVALDSPLAKARRITIQTGSGDVRIAAAPNASFDLTADQGSGDLVVHYRDATLRHTRHKTVGARRGDGRTAIHIETGSGDCVVTPKGS